ncbi:bifunctional diguanylate cyclase/phosphodiesterase [Legionella hackeliae]|uniref:Uncharacterized protein n=1 Tax=Legionella hackeliae TaxID=449 RepID=A0A0A8UQN6_LEGHA|nr:EAL domain-containing protein [Legionella hackeliae]KTD15489.1 two component histidine kinase [Legionella hackeliae]CEK11140.1 conserved exported protein of unknown function [Legionella hackeliae]STX47898.1 two component histidine kinase, GGDEF domain protein/EAL domain protein [Legionella hackeliae]
MTLAKKMSLVVLSLLMLIFIGSYLITLNNERNYFIEQLSSNAQDTATSLGLSLSQALMKNDKALMHSMVQAVFDRGYFSMIEVRDLNGRLLASRYASTEHKKTVPNWFYKLVQWQPVIQSSIVMRGWNQVGEVFVTTDSNYALHALWNNAFYLTVWYAIFAVISLFIIYFFIHWLLKPLKRVTQQAQEICLRKFPIQKEIPKTPELRQVTLAMNKMVRRIKEIFNDQLEQMEKLSDQSLQDPLTNLGNRRYFLQQLTSLLSDEKEFAPGFMILVAVDGLESVNKEQGFQQGDKVLCDIADGCTRFWTNSVAINISRISGTNFGLLIQEHDPDVFIKNCESFNQTIQKLINAYPSCEVAIAALSYSFQQTSTELLIEADRLLKIARHEPSKLAYSPQLSIPSVNITKDAITAALSELRFSLYGQWVVAIQGKLHQEVFVRLNEAGKEINAGYFMPIAEKEGVAYLIDQVVLSKVITANLLNQTPLALNITEETITNTNYRSSYLDKLEQLPIELRKRLHIEFNEKAVLKNFSKTLLFVQSLQKLSITVGIDQVGVNFSQMHYLNELPINYIKLHGSLFCDVTENQNKQFFIHYFNEMAKILDIKVIATFIETQDQWGVLQSLGLKWGQGQFLSGIQPL